MQGSPVEPVNRIPIEDWDRAPWNRWSFQHVREIVPTAEVWRGNGPINSLAESPVDFSSLTFKDFADREQTVSSWLDMDFNDGLIVLYQDSIVHESYRNNMTNRSLHLSQSVAKSVTSCVAGILIEEGFLDPGELITTYLPELESTAYRGATLQQLLNMSSGVRYIEDYEALDSHIAATDIACAWKPPRPGFNAPNCVWDQILTLTDADAEHGERFNYRSIETDVIAHAMERTSGKRLTELVSQYLWQPLGCEESANFTVGRAGYPLACGGFNATLRDYARVGLMLSHYGQANGRQIVPEQWVRNTTNSKPNIVDAERKKLMPNDGYKNQFWLRNVDTNIMMARGVFGQLIYTDPDSELVVVILSTWPEFTSIDRSQTALNGIDAMLKHLTR
ncbi:MAG: CubicO group peptidase (beta-lactamase class C family) [Gammaproteobacteria bacterium]|jgi:CubicO group peptidase (beta-lactamase class C family)